MTRDIPFIAMADWAAVMRPVITKALNRCECIVATGSVLSGFIAFERPDYVLYVYVPQPFRRNGIARGLFAAAGIDPESRFAYAARTKASWELRSRIPLAVYDPYRCRFPRDDDRRERNQP